MRLEVAGSPILGLHFSSCLDGLVERSAARTPDVVCARSGQDERTFRQLDSLAGCIATALQRYGVGTGTFVAVCVDRSLEAIAVLIAIAKAGGVFIPLDPTAPDERLASMIRDAAPRVVITSGEDRSAFQALDGSTVIAIDQLCAGARNLPPADRRIAADPTGLAYVMYTSGSTGLPKGVMIEHRSVCNMLLSAIADFNLTPADRVLQLAPLHFDPSIWQIFGTLAAGACIVLPEPRAERDVDAIAREVRARAVTVLIAVPTILTLLSERDDASWARSLRAIVSGGAPLPLRLRDHFSGSGVALYNVYGPTEAAIHVTTHRCTEGDRRDFVPIGAPIDNMHVYVVDEAGARVRAGEVGELYIGGRGVARGYLRQSELTAERFIPDHLAPGNSRGQLYRTGDFARLHLDGSIEFVGRIDDQIKVRGVRVELGEIVTALERHSGVASAVVILTADERLAAFVVPRGDSEHLGAVLNAFLRSVLPAAVIPSVITPLDALPLLASGKIDRAALAQMCAGRRGDATDTPLPGPLYVAILRLWEEVLGIRNIGLHDNFFELGGHSLLATRLVASVEERTGRRMPLDVMFANPTIAGMAEAIRDGERAALQPIVALHSDGSKAPFFFLHGDASGLGLYCRRFADGLDGDRPIYVLAQHGTDGRRIPPTIEQMAADYLPMLLDRYPEGPFVLGGYCFGGFVAFELARQLERRGRDVRHLILVEAQHARPLRVHWLTRWRERISQKFHSFRPIDPMRAGAGEALAAFVPDKVTANVYSAQFWAVKRYAWRRAGACATMLCASEAPRTPLAEIPSIWSALFPTLDIRMIPGDHVTALADHIDVLTGAIATVLAEKGS
jgi:amino acid adenylation domain-containing protein